MSDEATGNTEAWAGAYCDQVVKDYVRNSAPFDADAWRITQPSIADVKQGDILHVTRGGFDYDLRVTDVIPAAEASEGTVTICTVPA